MAQYDYVYGFVPMDQLGHIYIYIHTHTHIYTYIHVCVCVCIILKSLPCRDMFRKMDEMMISRTNVNRIFGRWGYQ